MRRELGPDAGERAVQGFEVRPRSYVAVLGGLESPTEIVAEVIAGPGEDYARFWRLAQSFTEADVIVVRREMLETYAATRALLDHWDATQGALSISDYQTDLRPNLDVVRDQTDVPGWVGAATRFRAAGPATVRRGERIMLRTLENIERSAELRSRLMKLQILHRGPHKL